MAENTVPELPFHEMPAPPEQVSGATVLCRLAEGLAFRYRWATEGLREQDGPFKPCATSMTLLELLKHIHGLVTWTGGCLGFPLPPGGPTPERIEEFRWRTLQQLEHICKGLRLLGDAELAAKRARDQPFWNLINGPLADALTHVGQLNAWRRINGNPWPGANVFLGKAPPPKPQTES